MAKRPRWEQRIQRSSMIAEAWQQMGKAVRAFYLPGAGFDLRQCHRAETRKAECTLGERHAQ